MILLKFIKANSHILQSFNILFSHNLTDFLIALQCKAVLSFPKPCLSQHIVELYILLLSQNLFNALDCSIKVGYPDVKFGYLNQVLSAD